MFYCLVTILLSIIFNCNLAKRVITFRAQSSVSGNYLTNSINGESLSTKEVESFFMREDFVDLILSLNKGIERVEMVDNDIYRGYLAPLEFPGIKMTNSIDFKVNYTKGKRLTVSCTGNDALKQEYEGPARLIKLISNLIPEVRSTNVLEYDDTTIRNSATLEIEFPIPQLFPIPSNILEERGSEAIQKGVDRDLDGLVNGVLVAAVEWKKNNLVSSGDSSSVSTSIRSSSSDNGKHII